MTFSWFSPNIFNILQNYSVCVAQSSLTLVIPWATDGQAPLLMISQTRILERVAIILSKTSSQNPTHPSRDSANATSSITSTQLSQVLFLFFL